MSHKVYLFNIYSLIQECYYQTTLPPPLSLVERLVELLVLLVKLCRRGCKSGNRFDEDSFSKFQQVIVSNLIEYALRSHAAK